MRIQYRLDNGYSDKEDIQVTTRKQVAQIYGEEIAKNSVAVYYVNPYVIFGIIVSLLWWGHYTDFLVMNTILATIFVVGILWMNKKMVDAYNQEQL